MSDLTKEEHAEAAAQNWGFFHVFDTERSKWTAAVLPLVFSTTSTPTNALNQVIAQAKYNHPLSIKVLRLLAQYNTGKKT